MPTSRVKSRVARGDAPFEIALLTLEGPGIGIEAEGTIAGPAQDFLTQTSVTLHAEDASRFAALAGLALGGAAEVAIVSSVEPLNGLRCHPDRHDPRLAHRHPSADAVLAGDGALTIAAARDEQGARITGLTYTTPTLTATGSADLTNDDARASFDIRMADAGNRPARPARSRHADRDRSPTHRRRPHARCAGHRDRCHCRDRHDRRCPRCGRRDHRFGSWRGGRPRTLCRPCGPSPCRERRGSCVRPVRPDLSTFDVTAVARTRDLAIGIQRSMPFWRARAASMAASPAPNPVPSA